MEFWTFRRNLFHGSLNKIHQTGLLEWRSLRSYIMEMGIIGAQCLGPYIAGYPEQVLLACIVQRGRYCPGTLWIKYSTTISDLDWCRCDARWDDLDHTAGCRSHRLMEVLLEAMGTKALWDDYGIIDRIMVCTLSFLQAEPWLSLTTAIYPWIRTCRHSRTTLARFITPN